MATKTSQVSRDAQAARCAVRQHRSRCKAEDRSEIRERKKRGAIRRNSDRPSSPSLPR